MIAVCLLPLVGGSEAKVRVNSNTHAFTQVSGRGPSGREIVRELYFHGVNYVRKGPPYIIRMHPNSLDLKFPAATPPGPDVERCGRRTRTAAPAHGPGLFHDISLSLASSA